MLCYSSHVGLSESVQPRFDGMRIYHPRGQKHARQVLKTPKTRYFLVPPHVLGGGEGASSAFSLRCVSYCNGSLLDTSLWILLTKQFFFKGLKRV